MVEKEVQASKVMHHLTIYSDFRPMCWFSHGGPPLINPYGLGSCEIIYRAWDPHLQKILGAQHHEQPRLAATQPPHCRCLDFKEYCLCSSPFCTIASRPTHESLGF
jgi:hypothetical protein